jgi:hypothetical protein
MIMIIISCFYAVISDISVLKINAVTVSIQFWCNNISSSSSFSFVNAVKIP